MHRSTEGSPGNASLGERPGRQIVSGETIAAISTPAGEGAIALVRVSGVNAMAVADTIFRGKEKPSQFVSHVQHLGEIFDREGAMIDQAVVSVHRAPASYTGEDLVEISCHGGVLVTAKVLEACLAAGANGARPGEFTERAFLNGKMDLTQAEAVIDLIRAKTDLALRSATEQLEGNLGREIKAIRDELISLIAHSEASIDFPEEGIEPDDETKARKRLNSIRSRISVLLATADHGRVMREGLRVVIYGPTNAGKSSLLNRLLGYDRVIVSETPGTTRDTIEEVLNLRGLPIRLLDTAGLRSATDHLEQAGIDRTEKSLETADLRLHMADGNAPRPGDFEEHSANGSDLVVINKSDLPEHADWKKNPGIRISCLTGKGIGDLQEEVLALIAKGNLSGESAMAINTRHRDCLRRALEACDSADGAMGSSMAPEYVAVDLKEALRALGEILGTVDVEQILDSVFAEFCIGK